jgi:hypothetical protein
MNKVILAGAISLSFLTASAASAEQPSQNELRMQQVLKSMQAAVSPADATPRATVAKFGRIHVVVTFTKKQAFTLPVRCGVTLQNLNSTTFTYSQASRSEPLGFSGNTAKCTIDIDYDWPEADNMSGISVTLDLNNITTNPAANADLITRNWTKIIPVPAANGGIVNVAFGNLDI